MITAIARKILRKEEEVFDFYGIKLQIYKHQKQQLIDLQHKIVKVVEAIKRKPPILNLTDNDRRILRILCHPDKHNGSKQAEEMFKKIGEL